MTLHFSPDFWLSRAGVLNDLLPVGRPGLTAPAGREASGATARGPLEPADDIAPRVAELGAADGKSLAVFVPERYEPNYAYPLLVWLHNGAASSRDLKALMSRVSTRNYLGVTAACPELSLPLPRGAAAGLTDDVAALLRMVRRQYHVHTERVYPIGFGIGAAWALTLVLERPEFFGGAVALCGGLPPAKQPLFRFRELNQKPVLLAGGAKDESAPVAEIVRTGRLLHAGGLSVTTRVYDAAHEMTPRMLRDVDRWVMGGLGAVTV